MGRFSWVYSDIAPAALKLNGEAYVPFPEDKGAFGFSPGSILHEASYDGYGVFSRFDIFELIALWNREYLSSRPDLVMLHSGRKVSDYKWYSVYSNKRLSDEMLGMGIYKAGRNDDYQFELRQVGVDIGCVDRSELVIPFPVKICRFEHNAKYSLLSPSEMDEEQGY